MNQANFNLDHASGAPLDKDVKKAIKEFLDSPIYNTDSAYAPAVELRRHLADLKSKTAKLLGVKSPNILITNGSSDASSTLLSLITSADPKAKIITTNIEHSSLLDAVKKLPQNKLISIDAKGALNLADLKTSITDSTVLITIQYVNNETGQILPIKEVSRLANEVRSDRLKRDIKTPIFLHTDASQAAITQDLLIPRLGVDALSLNGSKFGGLPNSGILYLSADLLRWLASREVEVKQAKENPLSIISIYWALKHSIEKKNTETKRLTNLSKAFYQEIQKQIPEVTLNPKSLKMGKNHSPHILNIHIPNTSGERLVILAGLNGILTSTGAACSASKDKPSHVLEALGLTPQEIQSSIRVSFGSANKSEGEVKEAAIKLADLCQNPSVRL